jgi:beta-galactosidase
MAADPHRERDLAFAADRCRGLNRSQPWLLMEHSTSAVNWQGRNRAKGPGELIRNSLAHVARGSDGAMFFQWRQSASGAEQFHSGMVPHAGADTEVFRSVVELGGILRSLGEVAGSLVEPAQVAMVVSDVSGWAWSSGQKPVNGVPLGPVARQLHDALLARGILADVVPPSASLESYRLVIVPALYLVDDDTVARITAAAEAGATVLVTRLSGIVDADNRVRLGGYPGAFRELLGVRVQEFVPLQEGETVTLGDGSVAVDWTESLEVTTAEAHVPYAGSWLTGRAAITRRAIGAGSAWYWSAGIDDVDSLLGEVLADAGVTATVPVVAGVEAVRRTGDETSWLFLLNHSEEPTAITALGFDLISGAEVVGEIVLAGGGVAVIRER